MFQRQTFGCDPKCHWELRRTSSMQLRNSIVNSSRSASTQAWQMHQEDRKALPANFRIELEFCDFWLLHLVPQESSAPTSPKLASMYDLIKHKCNKCNKCKNTHLTSSFYHKNHQHCLVTNTNIFVTEACKVRHVPRINAKGGMGLAEVASCPWEDAEISLLKKTCRLYINVLKLCPSLYPVFFWGVVEPGQY